MTCDVVIGANYGDEGKGRITAYLAEQYDPEDTLVMLRSGGAQRGHTMIDRNTGYRHVFHQFNSATMSGYSTIQHNDFIINPITFRQEREELVAHGYQPTVYRAVDCRVTTPLYMIINQQYEMLTNHAHGSCGMGIWDTVQFSKYMLNETGKLFCLYYLATPDGINEFRETVMLVLRRYLFKYYTTYCETIYNSILTEYVLDDTLWENFRQDCEYMMQHTIQYNRYINGIMDYGAKKYNHLIIEQSQGLLLDKYKGDVLHPTPCNCTFVSAILYLFTEPIKINAHYVSRWYLTRHGNPDIYHTKCYLFDTETFDETNRPNLWQGTMNCYYLDEEALIDRICRDYFIYDRENSYHTYSLSIYITHLDTLKEMSDELHGYTFCSTKDTLQQTNPWRNFQNIYTFFEEVNQYNLYGCFSENNDDIMLLKSKRREEDGNVV